MSRQEENSRNEEVKDGTTELESHLNSLILSSMTPAQTQSAAVSSSYQSNLESAVPVNTSAEIDQASQAQPNIPANSQHIDQGATSGSPSSIPKKRPNQAQRRQMNSQLSIPVDPRPQYHPSSRPYFSPPGHPSTATSPTYQRHAYSNSQPRLPPQGGRSYGQYGNSHWNGSPQHYGSPTSHRAPFTHQQRNSYGYGSGSMSPQSIRHDSGLPYNNRRPQLYQPEPDEVLAQAALLDQLCFHVVAKSEIQLPEIAEKEAFRSRIEAISQEAIANYEEEQTASQGFPRLTVVLKCFGSLSSGFATKASDMDLGLLSPFSRTQPDAPDSQIPRLLEKAFLDAGLGARLLSRTRVPIIKLCEKPSPNLRADLLVKRAKWEHGLDNESHDDQGDEEHPDTVTSVHDHASSHQESTTANGQSQSTTEINALAPRAVTLPRFELRQTSTVLAYCGYAKRKLRKAGGREATMTNIATFTPRDWEVLNGFCEALVAGLKDPELRERLTRYPSLSFGPEQSRPNNRTLMGVITQIEGEHLIGAWEQRKFDESSPASISHTQNAVKTWKDVQSRTSFGSDPILYTKELQLAMERFRKTVSGQFLTLQQGQHETPSNYFGRAGYLISQLATLDGQPLKTNHGLVNQHYIAGIYHADIKTALQQALDTYGADLQHDAVSRRHKSLHLAWAFEKALDKELYEENQVADIKAYIALLQAPPQLATPNVHHQFSIPLSPEDALLVRRIAALPDPQSLAPNQPRDRYQDPLEFPKDGVGVQCDINFSAHLALQNTLLLRCYSHTDPRVRPMVLFVKHWAKTRGINSGYRGTLSSYGYVLMVLHYLVNVVQPFVCPNLQQLAPRPPPNPSPAEIETTIQCKGYNIQFWRNEQEIIYLAQNNQLNRNTQSLGHLLRGFFEYYAQGGYLSSGLGRGFDWGRDVLSLRTPGGLLSKHEKGWTGAKSVFQVQGAGPRPTNPAEQPSMQSGDVPDLNAAQNDGQAKVMPQAQKSSEVKEIRYRYLFAIEDPFELDHNVARTVTHNGIVSIRDEFRRAWRIIKSAGKGAPQEDLLHDFNDENDEKVKIYKAFLQLLQDIHGPLSVASE